MSRFTVETLERIDNMIVSALEGGSNYWISNIEVVDRKGVKYLSQVAQQGGILRIIDNEWEQPHLFDMIAIRKGFTKFVNWKNRKGEKHARVLDFENDNIDANTGDCFLQFCLFEDVIFG